MWTLIHMRQIIRAFLQWKLRRVDEQHEEARASGALPLSLGILLLRKGHKQEGCCPLWPVRAEQCKLPQQCIYVAGPQQCICCRTSAMHICCRTKECLVAPCSEECSSPSVTAGTGHSKDSQHVFPKRSERGGVAAVIWIFLNFWLSNWTKRLEAHPRGRSICFSSGQSAGCAGTQSTVNILWGLPPAKILPHGKNWKSEKQVDWTYLLFSTNIYSIQNL